MRCKCGFENAADARFCGSCRAALGNVPGSIVPNAVASSTAPPVSVGSGSAPTRSLPRATIAIIAVVVVVAAAGYWWMNRPPGPYKPDNSGLYPINVSGKYGFMDRAGKTSITPQFDATYGFSEGLGSVKIGTKWGYINTKGVVAITPQFDFALPFRNGRAVVTLGNRYGFIDKDGKYISSPTFRWAQEFSGEFAPVQTADGVFAFVSHSGELVLSGRFDGLSTGFSAGLAPAASAAKWGFIDTTGKWIIDPQFEGAGNFADGLAPVKVGGRWGYIDRKGKFVVNPQYDNANEFREGLASFYNGGKGGFIDTKGRVVVEAKFVETFPVSDGLGRVRTEDGFGFIDRTGKMVISPRFDEAGPFQNGLARVDVGGKQAYVTTAGAFVVDPYPGRSATPAHAVQEIWEGEADFSETSKRPQRLILIREATQIRGYHTIFSGDNQLTQLIDLKGQAAQDGSFSMADEDGASWKGRFVSAVLIKGVTVNWRWGSPERSATEYPVRLHLVRDATAQELPEPRPPTNSDWSAFLSSFKAAVQRRDSGVLAGMMSWPFYLPQLTPPADALARVKWDELERTLERGVERSGTAPLGRATRSIVDEHPCPTCAVQSSVSFHQDGDNQWRWSGFYPGN